MIFGLRYMTALRWLVAILAICAGLRLGWDGLVGQTSSVTGRELAMGTALVAIGIIIALWSQRWSSRRIMLTHGLIASLAAATFSFFIITSAAIFTDEFDPKLAAIGLGLTLIFGGLATFALVGLLTGPAAERDR